MGFNTFIDKLFVTGWYTYRKDLMYFYLDMSTKKQDRTAITCKLNQDIYEI